MRVVQTMPLAGHIHWVGALHEDSQFVQSFSEAKYGSTCNSFVVQGSQSVALFDVVSFSYLDDYLIELEKILGDLRKIDYVIFNRTDPAHSSALESLLNKVPKIKVVATEDALRLLRRTTTTKFEAITVTTGSTLDLGNRTIKFYYTPFRHMQDTMFSYLIEDRILFTCDAFSVHYCHRDMLLSKLEKENRQIYENAFQDYYHKLFGVSRSYVNKVMSYLSPLSVDMICPSHGAIIDQETSYFIDLYHNWAQEPARENANKSVMIPYLSDNEYTEAQLEQIIQGIKSVEDMEVTTYPLTVADYSSQKEEILQALENADAALFGSPTLNADAPPPILDLIMSMNPLRHGGKYLSAFGVYAWDNQAVFNILARLDQLNGLVMDGFSTPYYAIEQESRGAFNFGKSFAEYLNNQGIPPRRHLGDELQYNDFQPIQNITTYVWTCGVCTFRYKGETLPPAECPACGACHDLFFKDKTPTTDFQSDTPLKLVIIGNGAASVTAASEARRRNSKAEITIISEEAEDAYFRAEVAKRLVDGINPKKFYVRTPQWYAERNITILKSTRATKIDSKAKEVLFAGGSAIKYDKLIIATGSSPFVPSIRDAGSKRGVFTLHYKGDMKEIYEYAQTSSKVLIIGSGSLGLTLAFQLKRLGLEVEILEKSSRAFSKYVDKKGSRILEHGFKRMGIKFRAGCDIKAVIGDSLEATGVELEYGQRIRGDMIIFCTGIKPNVEIVRGTPLKVNKGLDVNENMRSLDASIYACGDVAEYKGTVVGLWSAAVSQGRIAGANAVGDKLAYKEVPQPVIFNMPLVHSDYPDLDVNMSLFSIGYVENIDTSRETDYSVLEHHDPEAFIYHKFYFEGEKLIAAILIGDVLKASLAFKAVMNEYTQKDFLHDYYR